MIICDENLLTIYLEAKRILSLQFKIQNGLFDHSFKFWDAFSWDINSGEEVANKTQKHGHIVGDDFGHVEISKGAHKNFILGATAIGSLEAW